MTVLLLNLYFLCSILLRIDITQVVCTKLNLKQYSPSLLTLVEEKRLTAHEGSAYWLFFVFQSTRQDKLLLVSLYKSTRTPFRS